MSLTKLLLKVLGKVVYLRKHHASEAFEGKDLRILTFETRRGEL
jgi:hypothetical protein